MLQTAYKARTDTFIHTFFFVWFMSFYLLLIYCPVNKKFPPTLGYVKGCEHFYPTVL